MKASKLIQHVQSQIDLYGDHDIEVTTTNDKFTSVLAIQFNIFGKIEIVIK